MADSEARTPARSEKDAGAPDRDRGWAPFWALRNEIEDLFEDVFRSGGGGGSSQRLRGRDRTPARRAPVMLPTLDVIDRKDAVKLVADLPGLTENDIAVEVTDGTLSISGEKKEEVEEGDAEGERYVAERRFGRFLRRIALPAGIDKDAVSAEFRNGVLTVHLPKTEEARNAARRIEISTGG